MNLFRQEESHRHDVSPDHLWREVYARRPANARVQRRADCARAGDLVERKTGYTLIGKLRDRSKAELTERAVWLIRKHRGRFQSITADNGTEFHDYKRIEEQTGVCFYFANPHHSWERGTNENTNGLIRQYLPKGTNMDEVTQQDCSLIAHALNHRPRKRLGFKDPEEGFNES